LHDKLPNGATYSGEILYADLRGGTWAGSNFDRGYHWEEIVLLKQRF